MQTFAAAVAAALLITFVPARAQSARVLDEHEIRATFLKQGLATRIKMLGSKQGRRYAVGLLPGGKLELSIAEGANVGRGWRIESGVLCLRAYSGTWDGLFNCGRIEVHGNAMAWVDEVSGAPNWIEEVKFEPPPEGNKWLPIGWLRQGSAGA